MAQDVAPGVDARCTHGRSVELAVGGDPTAVSAGGTYRGLYQFDLPTWRGVGGRGDPAAASAEEQGRRAAILYARRGPAPWPVCGYLSG